MMTELYAYSNIAPDPVVHPEIKGKPTLDTAMMTSLTDRANHIDEMVRIGIAEIKEKNAELAKLNAKMTELRKEKLGAKDERKAELDVDIEKLRGQVETLTSTSQLDMVRLQSDMYRYNNSYDTISNFIKKYFGTIQSIVANLRG